MNRPSKSPSNLSDLSVEVLSPSLKGRTFDLIVTGSIAAVESVRLIRALRRLGAEIQPWLSQGGQSFITPTSLSWAANRETRLGFAGDKTHIATNDGAIVAPCSANFCADLVHGKADQAGAALVHSYLGQQKPVYVLATMHHSLASSPWISQNLNTLANYVDLLPTREEEGKAKMPDPEILADEISHRFNRPLRPEGPVAITLGRTEGAIDPVRYISNYSSGALGSRIAEELYRFGFHTHVIAGSSQIRPRCHTTMTEAKTNSAMLKALTQETPWAGVMAASVLDYQPDHMATEKIPSGASQQTIHLKPTTKIIHQLRTISGRKVGFKLETELDEHKAQRLATDHMTKNQLSLMVINRLDQVDDRTHTAFLFGPDASPKGVLDSKQAIARKICQHLCEAP